MNTIWFIWIQWFNTRRVRTILAFGNGYWAIFADIG